MIEDVIKEIKEAEARAQEIIKDANAKAKEMVIDAENKAQEQRKDAVLSSRKDIKATEAEATKKALSKNAVIPPAADA